MRFYRVDPVVAISKPRRIAAFTALWRAVAQSSRPGAPSASERLRALPRMLRGAVTGRYPALSRARLGLIGLALAYLVSPIDLLPEAFLPLVGLADDGVIALWLGGAFLAETERFLAWERQQSTIVDAPPA
ncbi:uncharacterized membrane protein YkvA (DUF1232 family) [Pseudonocardia cypriaca]|uniref:Uncharacterized membrane protein YkvA (DUF1232 family) n=1 Tax=Pseudonocardia cypriaca TaxID=882449 RepID=A0A543GBP6_9PSEU|nr:uncharacterized membrane protein YkvA (DUF1232 family) [Pseudonocardia cypriaca]